MLLLKFWIKDKGNMIYIEDVVEDYDYKDGENVYLSGGSVPRKLIEGKIEEVWIEDD